MLSFRKRLALAHLGATLAVLALGASVAYWSFSRTVHRELDAALLALAETELGMLVGNPNAPAVVHEAPPGPAAPSFVRLDRLVQIVSADGSVAARSSNLGEAQLPMPDRLRKQLQAGETVFETLNGFGEEPTRLISVPVRGRPGLLAVQVAGSLDDVNQVVRSAGVLFLALGLALLLAVSAAGALLTRGVFRAIDDVVQRARRIGAAHRDERLPHPGTRDEIGRLVDTLNDMLARLTQSVAAQRRFTADASHELRSPMSRLRTELELALRRPRDPAFYVKTLHSALEEVERLTLLVEELLTLARFDAGQERGTVEPVLLHEIAQQAIQRLEPLARERQVGLLLAPSPPVTAAIARSAAELVLANLLDNALKFLPAGGEVRLEVQATPTEAVLRVSDSGPGLRADELPHLFERFYRGSTARQEDKPGVGLGLALSQAIVQAYGGRIEASNRPEGGASFSLWLPRADS